MNDKYLSEILTIGIQKEKYLRLMLLKRKLQQMRPKDKCPDWAREWMEEYGFDQKQKIRVESAIQWVDAVLFSQGRRCRIMERRDILPLIFVIAQKRYIEQMEAGQRNYDYREARKHFETTANTILTACNMERLNYREYELDAVLWMCYQEKEMYGLSDVLELL